jgi:hypothetical protein
MHELAALYIDPLGPYANRPDIDAYDEQRDARTYVGSLPVLLHPPCARWCQLAAVVEKRYGYLRGDDGGLFEHALGELARCGGVLEHPAYSKAWDHFGITKPRGPGWVQCADGYYVGQCSQVAYGHRARKRTWLIYYSLVGRPPFELRWDEPPHKGRVSGCQNRSRPKADRVWCAEAKRTPPAFAEELIRLAKHSRGL